jgi:hypothetical protein
MGFPTKEEERKNTQHGHIERRGVEKQIKRYIMHTDHLRE